METGFCQGPAPGGRGKGGEKVIMGFAGWEEGCDVWRGRGSREEKRFVGEEKGSFDEKGTGQRESFLFSTPFLREGDVDGGGK